MAQCHNGCEQVQHFRSIAGVKDPLRSSFDIQWLRSTHICLQGSRIDALGRTRPALLHLHVANLNDGLHVRVVGHISHDLRGVRSKRFLEITHGFEE